MNTCPYCNRPRDERGGIFHAGNCLGLESVILNRLQYDALKQAAESLLDTAQRVEDARDAARYRWLVADADRGTQLMNDAYADWDTDEPWREWPDSMIDAAINAADRENRIPEGEVPVLNPQGTGETGADRPASPFLTTDVVESACKVCGCEERTPAGYFQCECPAPKPNPRFPHTYCSQCGKEFGPGDNGYSHCSDHSGIMFDSASRL